MSAADEVLAAARHLVQAFGRHDTAAYFDCFAPDATFIFYTRRRQAGVPGRIPAAVAAVGARG